jgi:hypothetical protein
VYEQDKSTSWGVNEEELELIPETYKYEVVHTGDWVALKINNKEIGQITKITGYICWGKRYTSFPEYLRKATQEEIEKATEQTVSMNGKFNLTVKDKRVFHKNEDITSFVEGIGGLYDNRVLKRNFGIKNYDFHVKDMILSKTGCESQETYLSDWLKVYELIK